MLYDGVVAVGAILGLHCRVFLVTSALSPRMLQFAVMLDSSVAR